MNGLDLMASIHINEDGAGTWRSCGGIARVINDSPGVYRIFLRRSCPTIDTVEISNLEENNPAGSVVVENISEFEKRIRIFNGGAPTDLHVHVTICRAVFDPQRGDAT